MQVLRLITPRRNGMHVHVKNSGANQSETRQTGFFLGFPPGHSRYIGVAVGMATGLKPTVQFAVMQKYHLPMIGRNNPGRAGDVTNEQSSIETIGLFSHEPIGLVEHGLLSCVIGCMGGQ